MDLMIYQEIIIEIHPDVIIECGTFNGCSALFFASIFDLLGKGKVISIDLAPQPGLPYHPRIQYITASSKLPQTVEHVKGMLNKADIVMVLLDSDHTKSNVMKELSNVSSYSDQGKLPDCGRYKH
jgi:cephalosporin hydroxylase